MFSSVAIRLYGDRLAYWKENALAEEVSEELEEEEVLEEDEELSREDIILHIDRVFSSMVLNEKKSSQNKKPE